MSKWLMWGHFRHLYFDTFQWCKERLNVTCFDPCNWTLKFWESWRTPKSPFQECECHLQFFQKWGCDMVQVRNQKYYFSGLTCIQVFVKSSYGSYITKLTKTTLAKPCHALGTGNTHMHILFQLLLFLTSYNGF
jgi:hypothetical protein